MKALKLLWLPAMLLYCCSTSAQIYNGARVLHVAPNGNDSLGSIILDVSGGTAPYTYAWNKGLYPNAQNRTGEKQDDYTVTIKDAAGDSSVFTCNIGYKMQWGLLQGMAWRNDSLLPDGPPPPGWAGATSSNMLRPNTDGWMEMVLNYPAAPSLDIFITGFTDSTATTDYNNYADIEFGCYITPDGYLYGWNGNDFNYVGMIHPGCVIRLERRGSYCYLVMDEVTLYYQLVTPNGKSKMVKAIMGNNTLANAGASFADSTSAAGLTVKGLVSHIAPDGIASEGKITLAVQGGATPYTYHWLPGNATNKDQLHATAGTYSVTVKDYNNDSLTYYYSVGYKNEWASLSGCIFRNDSLISDGSTLAPGDNRAAISENTLPKNTTGWVEWVVPDSNDPMAIGFLDSIYAIYQKLPYDIDFAMHVTSHNLYAYSFGSFYYLGNAYAGDVLRMERTPYQFYLKKNGVTLFSSTSSLFNKDLKLKALFVNDPLFNCGSSFGQPLNVDYNTVGVTDDNPNGGYIYLAPKGGVPPYHYLWSNDSTQNALTDLGLGSYSVTITDSGTDTVKLTFNIGVETKLVYLSNLAMNGDGKYVKPNYGKTGMANTSTYINGSEGGYYEFKLGDVNTNFNFVFNPYDTLAGLQSQVPVAVRQTTISVNRSSLPTPGTAGYNNINFADTVTTGTTANVIQKEFVSDTCTVGCDRLLLAGIQFDYGKMYVLTSGVTIEKGITVDPNSTLRLGLTGSEFDVFDNAIRVATHPFTPADINLVGAVPVKAPGVVIGSISSGPAGVPHNTSANEGCYDCAGDATRNFVENTTFDDQGAYVTVSRAYYDNLGRTLQTQVKNLTEKNILATQVLYDAYGRQVGATLPAPINASCFCYKQGFITNSSNTDYTYNDFDVPDHTTNPSVLTSGERDMPKAVGNTVPGTLGWYYCNNNSLEKYVPAAATPYSRVEYSSVDASSVYKTSKPGSGLNSGSGHEAYTFKMATMGELDFIFGAGLGWRVDAISDFYGSGPCDAMIKPLPLLNTSPLSSKIINVDENGNETVTFVDLTGNVIATCLSGTVNGSNVQTQTIQSWLSFTDEANRYLDVHLPEGCQSSLAFSYPGGTPATYPNFNIINLKTNEYVMFGSYNIFSGAQPNLPPGYYRIMVVPGSTSLQGVNIVQNLNYYNFALNYYDYANRLKAVVPPNGFDYATIYNASPITQNTSRTMQTIVSAANQPNYFETGHTWSLNGATFENTIPLSFSNIGRDSSSSFSMRITIGNQLAPAMGEVPGQPSSDERTPAHTTARGNYLAQTYLTSTLVPAPPSPDSVYTSITDVYFKVAIGLLDGSDHLIDGSVQESGSLKCTVMRTATGEYRAWYPVEFMYNNNFANTSTLAISPAWSKIQLMEFEPVYATLGTNDLTQYESLTGDLKVSVGIGGLNAGPKQGHKMVERYRYNSWSELQNSISPDEGQTDYVYSKDGKPKFTQNSKQDASNATALYRKFSYVNYDASDRPVNSGEYVPPASPANGQYYFFENYDERAANSTSPPQYSVHDVNLSEGIINYSPYAQDEVNMVYDSPDPLFYAQTNLAPAAYTQRHLTGVVAYSYNNNKKTWYSYDELGRVEWVVQKYYAMNVPGANYDVVKTFNYKYDFLGNVTEVDYNTGNTTDRFYHYYEYDQDKRLKRVYTSRDGVNKTLQAQYDFYLHGPLKRIELANKLQGIDFVYTINGWLKSMNSPEMDSKHDAGNDGYLANSSNSTYKDIFGLSLDYFLNDYERQGTYVQGYDESQNTGAPFAPDLFNGVIKGQRWQTRTQTSTGLSYANQQLMYGYLYDKKYQLKEANFATITANGTRNLPAGDATTPAVLTTSIKPDYRTYNLSYDDNGNILRLTRKAWAASANGINLDDLTYTYQSCTNRLNNAADAVSTNPYNTLGFKPGQSSNNYQYNSLGELTTNTNDNKAYEYNSLGNITALKDASGNLLAQYTYDEMGYRIKKIAYLSGGTVKYTWYVRDAGGQVVSTYEKTANGSNTSFGAPLNWNVYGSTRLGVLDNTGGQPNYLYELSDQLGNVRATFKKQIKSSLNTNFNGNGADDNWFNNNGTLDNSLDVSGLNYMVKTQLPTRPFGAGSRPVPVKNGDVVTVNWKTLYQSAGLPNAGMVVQLTDAAGNLLPGCWQYFAMGGSSNVTQSNQFVYTIGANYPDMYLSMYPWNQDNTNKVAYFDDFSLTFSSGGVNAPDQISMATYYPHGGVMPGMSYNSSYSYNYGYQGQFAEKDDESNESFFELRNYDPLLGRFATTDPYGQYYSPYMAMGNSHPNSIDPDGGWSAEGAVIGGAIGGVVGAGIVLGNHRNMSTEAIVSTAFGSIAAGALIGGVVTDLGVSASRGDLSKMITVGYRVIELSNGGAIIVDGYNGTFSEKVAHAGLDVTYSPPNGNTSYFNWFQTMHTNSNPNMSNLGSEPLAEEWFVDSPSENPQHAQFYYHWSGDMPGGGGNPHFSHGDVPIRKVNKNGNIYVDLETSLAELQVDGTYKNLGTLSWGFTLSKTGVFRLKPLILTKPSAYHQGKFNELK